MQGRVLPMALAAFSQTNHSLQDLAFLFGAVLVPGGVPVRTLARPLGCWPALKVPIPEYCPSLFHESWYPLSKAIVSGLLVWECWTGKQVGSYVRSDSWMKLSLSTLDISKHEIWWLVTGFTWFMVCKRISVFCTVMFSLLIKLSVVDELPWSKNVCAFSSWSVDTAPMCDHFYYRTNKNFENWW